MQAAGATNSSTVEGATEMVTRARECVACFAMQAAGAMNSSTVEGAAKMVTHTGECMCTRGWCQMMRRASNLTNRFEHIGVYARVLKRSDGSRHRRRITLPRNGTKSMEHVQGGGAQGGAVGATPGSDNGEAGGAESMEDSGSLAATQEVQGTCLGNGSAC
jgi:hypothetical protein